MSYGRQRIQVFAGMRQGYHLRVYQWRTEYEVAIWKRPIPGKRQDATYSMQLGLGLEGAIRGAIALWEHHCITVAKRKGG